MNATRPPSQEPPVDTWLGNSSFKSPTIINFIRVPGKNLGKNIFSGFLSQLGTARF